MAILERVLKTDMSIDTNGKVSWTFTEDDVKNACIESLREAISYIAVYNEGDHSVVQLVYKYISIADEYEDIYNEMQLYKDDECDKLEDNDQYITFNKCFEEWEDKLVKNTTNM